MNMNEVNAMTPELLSYIEKTLKQSAEKAEYSAGMNGGTAPAWVYRYKTEIDFYVAGTKNQIPTPWKELAKDFFQHNDPEYEEYTRLKKKFEE